jgi:hypothetical protein
MRMIARRATKVPSRSLSTRSATTQAPHCAETRMGRLPRHGQRSLGCGSGSMSAPLNSVSCGSLRPFPLHAHASPSPGRPRHGQRSLGCGSGSNSAPFHNVSCGSLRPFPLHATRVRVRGAFLGDLLCRSACEGGQPLAAPRFAHLIPESHRRARVELVQRFPKCECNREWMSVDQRLSPLLRPRGQVHHTMRMRTKSATPASNSNQSIYRLLYLSKLSLLL